MLREEDVTQLVTQFSRSKKRDCIWWQSSDTSREHSPAVVEWTARNHREPYSVGSVERTNTAAAVVKRMKIASDLM